jgi:hypothetical protein
MQKGSGKDLLALLRCLFYGGNFLSSVFLILFFKASPGRTLSDGWMSRGGGTGVQVLAGVGPNQLPGADRSRKSIFPNGFSTACRSLYNIIFTKF